MFPVPGRSGLKGFFLLTLSAVCPRTVAQSDTLPVDSSARTGLSFEAYADVYFAFDATEPSGFDIPYFVSHVRHNEFNVNLACVTVRYASDRVRGTFTPGYGTYMNANYAAERTTLQNLVEANIGVRVFKDKNIWLDAGVVPSPFTNENAFAIDQATQTRSLGAEYIPYYLSGARLTLPLGKRWTLYGYVINGWQQIQDNNAPLAGASWLEFKPSDRLSLNWNNYYGYERSEAGPANRMRMFTDAYAVWSPSKRWSFTASAYMGWQERVLDDRRSTDAWWQANATAKHYLKSGNAFYARAERFSDPEAVMVAPITGVSGFEVFSGTIGHERSITDAVKFRMEARLFQADDKVYVRDGDPVAGALIITGGLVARFK